MRKLMAVLGAIFFAIMATGCANRPTAPQTVTTAADTNQVTSITTSITSTPTTPVPTAEPTYTMAEVAAANNTQKCWTVVDGLVYDLTSYLNRHPGGQQAVLKMCGIDGTAAFIQKHGGQPNPEQILAGLKIGTLQ